MYPQGNTSRPRHKDLWGLFKNENGEYSLLTSPIPEKARYRHSSEYYGCRRVGLCLFGFSSLKEEKNRIIMVQWIVLMATHNLGVEILVKGLGLHLRPEILVIRVPVLSVLQAGGCSQCQQEWVLGAGSLLGNKGRVSEKCKWCSKARSLARSFSLTRGSGLILAWNFSCVLEAENTHLL